jgi:hypothetical protein
VPQDPPPPSADIHAFYTAIADAFENLFVRQCCGQDIADVVVAVDQGRPIRPLLESDKGSFSTIFAPFHARQVFPINVQQLVQGHTLHAKLVEFCTLAATIEGLTDAIGMNDSEPTEEQKRSLAELLRTFLAALPTAQVFQSWLK